MTSYPSDHRVEDLKRRLFLRFPSAGLPIDHTPSLLRAVLQNEDTLRTVEQEEQIYSFFEALTVRYTEIRDALDLLLKKEAEAHISVMERIKALIEDYLSDPLFHELEQKRRLAVSDSERQRITNKTYQLLSAIDRLPIRVSEAPLQVALHPLKDLQSDALALSLATALSRFDEAESVKRGQKEISALLTEIKTYEAKIGGIYRKHQIFRLSLFPNYQRNLLPLLRAEDSGLLLVEGAKETLLLATEAAALRLQLSTLLSDNDEPHN